jgi:hypothetical protein
VTLAEQIIGALGCFEARPLISGPVRDLREGCLELNPPKIRHALAELVGLGPGLTPAGDDYLCGYLAALQHLSGENPRAVTARTLIADAMGTGPRPTQPLSDFLLGEYRTGMIPEFLSNCLQALLHPSTTAQLSRSVRRVLSHGATSGTEMMLGLLDSSNDFCQVYQRPEVDVQHYDFTALFVDAIPHSVRTAPGPPQAIEGRP